MLQLKEITKIYASGDTEVTALRGVTVSFRLSEFVSILGQSGCGKTTLLNIIGGLDQYTAGDLIISGRSTKQFRDRDWDAYRNHSIGFVFQSYNLIPHQTVLSNVELALTLSGVSKTERRRRAREALEKVGLGDQLKKKPNQMSGGQMQRVAIARALVNDPEILLADEPTGALDSATSLQIMDLLRQIAADKLVIMVTHNPALAEQFSTRIIRLLDGEITDDTNPCTEEEPAPDLPIREKKKKAGKTSMSLFTAMSLSLNNLMTKKTRTLLTSFAGSIGIIGIALILSLSNGVQAYISRVEEDTLSSYPVTITESAMDVGTLMESMTGNKDKTVDHTLDKIYSNNLMTRMMDTMLAEVTTNNLSAFKTYLEKETTPIDGLVSDIQYGYSTPLNIYKADTTDGAVKVNPNTLMQDLGLQPDTSNTVASSSMMTSAMGRSGNDVWMEMLGNKELLEKQYDVLAGRMPESYDEIVLIADQNNEVTDYTLYSLGMLDKQQLEETLKKLMAGEDADVNTEQVSYTYDELLALRFKLLVNSDYYEQTGNTWQDRREDEMYVIQQLNAKGIELKVTGILRPNSDAAAAPGGTVGYTSALMEQLITQVNDSAIVKAQQTNPDTDVLTGLPFKTDGEAPVYTMADIQAYIATLPAEQQQQAAASIAQMQSGGMSDEKIAELFAKQAGTMSTDNTYDGNLDAMGVADLTSPSSIRIYPVDFESKDKIADLITEYNNGVDTAYDITYTDYVKIIMSSVTTIINAISYILIAFVGISLVVSSIMIGIITYISVLERTKEIGILRSIGASKKDISRVFNAETLIIGFVAGAIGIGMTLLLNLPINALIRALADISAAAALPPLGGVILVAISMLLTFIAGLIPSRLAARKDPVIALRSE